MNKGQTLFLWVHLCSRGSGAKSRTVSFASSITCYQEDWKCCSTTTEYLFRNAGLVSRSTSLDSAFTTEPFTSPEVGEAGVMLMIEEKDGGCKDIMGVASCLYPLAVSRQIHLGKRKQSAKSETFRFLWMFLLMNNFFVLILVSPIISTCR